MAFIPLILMFGPNKSAFATDYIEVSVDGTASASSEESPSLAASKAFDSSIYTTWGSGIIDSWPQGDPPPSLQTAWLKYQLPCPQIVTKYEIPLGGLTSWDLQGSNDDSSWTTLHSGIQTQLGQQITFSNTTLYRYYRILAEGVVECYESPLYPGYFVCFYGASAAELDLYASEYFITGTLEDDHLYTRNVDIGTYYTTEFKSSSTGSVTLNPGFHAKAGSTCLILSGDSDQDGISDSWEIAQFGSISIHDDYNADPDGDDISLYWEYLLGLSGTVPEFDSDNDGMPDWYEVVEYQTLNNNEQTGDCDCD
jgi:hypothetical protein